MVRRLGKGRSAWSRGVRDAAARVVGTRGFTLLRWPALTLAAAEDADSIERHLSDQLGTEIRVGIMLGTARANQKPVLQVFSLNGEVIAYAKIGHNDLTRDLVRSEADALRLLARHRPTTLRAPDLLYHGQWRSLDVLAMSPLTGDLGLHAKDEHRVTAMAELAGLLGPRRQDVADSAYFRLLEHRIGAVADPELEFRLRRCRERIARRWPDTTIEWGAWHGDWGHWNMALDGDVIKLWDWERFDPDVPRGFDGLHFRAQSVRPTSPERQEQERRFLERVADELLSISVPEPLHQVTLALYLLEMSVRYATDLNHPAGEPVRARCLWALELLEREVEVGSTTGPRRGTLKP